MEAAEKLIQELKGLGLNQMARNYEHQKEEWEKSAPPIETFVNSAYVGLSDDSKMIMRAIVYMMGQLRLQPGK